MLVLLLANPDGSVLATVPLGHVELTCWSTTSTAKPLPSSVRVACATDLHVTSGTDTLTPLMRLGGGLAHSSFGRPLRAAFSVRATAVLTLRAAVALCS